MKVLAVDTSSVVATCAVLDEEKIIGEYSLNQKLSHSEKLSPMIKELMDSLKLKIKDIDIFASAIGPGSFTGLRIGIATINSFAHVVDKPVIGVSTLEALAFNLPNNDIVVPMMDARRDRVYTGIYKWINGELCNIMEPKVMKVRELINVINNNYDKVSVNGDGTLKYKKVLEDNLKDRIFFAPRGFNNCRATSVGELAILKYNAGEVDNYFTLTPEYLRESQAQREYNKRQ